MIAHLSRPAITLEHVAAELAREHRQRAEFYPGRVAKGNMLQRDADHELAIAAAWLDDVSRMAAAWGNGHPPEPSRFAFTWHDRRAALQRELELRARFYPEWIAKGRLAETDAAHRTACLEALLAIYEDGFDWRGSDGKTPFHSATADQEFTAMRADVAARQGRSQKELDLA